MPRKFFANATLLQQQKRFHGTDQISTALVTSLEGNRGEEDSRFDNMRDFRLPFKVSEHVLVAKESHPPNFKNVLPPGDIAGRRTPAQQHKMSHMMIMHVCWLLMAHIP
jgi:hypothetical protein